MLLWQIIQNYNVIPEKLVVISSVDDNYKLILSTSLEKTIIKEMFVIDF